MRFIRYDVHPDTKKKFIGFQIPFWEKVLKAVKESALKVRHLRHVGWDVAITKRGEVEFIEANGRPNFDFAQVKTQVGLRPFFEKQVNMFEEKFAKDGTLD